MQAALRRVWPRFSYMGVAVAEAARRQGNLGRLPRAATVAAPADATATLLQVLRARLRLRSARRRRAREGSAASLPPQLRPKAGCEADPYGGDVSPWPPPAGAAAAADGTFEGRTVNGWVI